MRNAPLPTDDITARLAHARTKHPVFASGAVHAVAVIRAELDELEYAVLHESAGRQKDEALDVIATAVRFFLQEFQT